MTGLGGVLIGLSAAALSGLALGRWMLSGLSKAEKLAWSLVLGLLLQAALFLLLVTVRPGADPALPFGLLCAVLVALLLRRPRTAETRSHPAALLPFSVRCLLAAAGAGVALFLVVAVSEPMWTADYLAVWGLKAKTIFLTASVPARLFHDPQTPWSHPEYPLLLPLDLAALAVWARGWDDRAVALLYPLCQAATAAAAFGFLARRGRIFGGAVAAAIVAWFFPLYAPAHVGMADIPLALGLVLLSTALLDAFEADSGAVRARLAIASLFCAATKFEGALFADLAALFWLVARPRGRAWAPVLAALLVPPVAHRTLMYLVRGTVPARDFDFTLLAPSRCGQWLGRIAEAVSHIASVEVVAAAIPLAALAVFLLVTPRGAADRPLPLLAGQMLGYVLACSLAAAGVASLVETSFARTTYALFPALAVVLGGRVAKSSSE